MIYQTFRRELAIVLSPDKRYRFIGAIFEKELEAERKQGFYTYQEALQCLDRYGYKLFK